MNLIKQSFKRIKFLFKPKQYYIINDYMPNSELVGYTLDNKPIFKQISIIEKQSKNMVDTVTAAKIIGVSETTLRRWRKTKKGPNYKLLIQFKAVYDLKELKKFQNNTLRK